MPPDNGHPARRSRQIKWTVAAGVAFGISFFLPALDGASGFSCLSDCWRILIRSDEGHTLPAGEWLYYSGFVAANALFVLLVFALFVSTAFPRVRYWASLASLLQVLSWPVVCLSHVEAGEHLSLRSGYYLWLAAYILLFCAHSVRVLASNPKLSSGAPTAGLEPRHP
jgi:hypothetical protein